LELRELKEMDYVKGMKIIDIHHHKEDSDKNVISCEKKVEKVLSK